MSESTQETHRLETLVTSGRTIKFFDSADKQYPQIKWTVWGALDTNEIIVRASAGTISVWRSAPSILLNPSMADRRFGIDIADSEVANRVSMEIWETESERLIKAINNS